MVCKRILGVLICSINDLRTDCYSISLDFTWRIYFHLYDFQAIIPKIQALCDADLVAFQKNGFIEIDGHRLEAEDIRIFYSFEGEYIHANRPMKRRTSVRLYCMIVLKQFIFIL